MNKRILKDKEGRLATCELGYQVFGSGSFGFVQELSSCVFSPIEPSHDVFLGKKVLKTLYNVLKEEDYVHLQRLTTLCHPNLVRCLMVGHIVNTNELDLKLTHIIMEYCEGGNLNHLAEVEPRKMTENYVLHLAEQVAKAIAYLHTRDPVTIYGDLKGKNILFKDKACMQVKIADLDSFGTFKGSRTQHGFAKDPAGSLTHMSPEMLRTCDNLNSRTNMDELVGRKTDIYSFACLILELINNGRVPYTDKNKRRIAPEYLSQDDFRKMINEGYCPDVSILRFASNAFRYSVQLEALLNQCLNRNPEERPDCNDLLACVSYLRTGGNPRLCIDISNFLRETYKDYSWDIVVPSNHKVVHFLVAPKHTKDIWLQRAGSTQDEVLGPTTTENTILLRGKQSQGCFVFYRYTPDSKTTVVVFWVDPKLMTDGRLKVAGSINSRLKGANVLEVTSYLQNQAMDYLFAVGIFDWNGVIGVQLTREADLLDIDDDRTVLVCLPMLKSIVLPPKDEMTLVAQDRVSQYTVFRYQQLLDGISATLAVKAISVANVSAQQVVNQVSVLDVNLGFLLRFRHENLVRYLSLQFDDSTDSLARRTYNIVMEFCEGTELTKFVRNVLPMSTVVNFSCQILDGLTYLHKSNVSHRALHGDHVMVTGFGANSVGRVRLISIARIRELLPRENQSFDPNHSDRILPLFMPPEVAERVGSKTDIWSFGCVMIQIITGDLPVMEKRQFSATVERIVPQIPDQIPPVLDDVIRQCLHLEYDKRPSAMDLLKKVWMSQAKVQGLFTPPR
ncbi:putative Serine/threonine-protein kinase STE11 [Hypsibius exemplaris]|uniref:non-specific serine/threonine protein kinase n=1 Tax=Hypsibius exemplaris TaxID=2072580 RepID=A0A9X6RP68_HYPEX|nr:putative Serine/threonine-protein kinase STE11 [Hypsibius exemplaris]